MRGPLRDAGFAEPDPDPLTLSLRVRSAPTTGTVGGVNTAPPVRPARDGLKAFLAIVAGAAAALMGVETLTVPMIASTGPAILTVGLAAAAYLLWRSSAIAPLPESTMRLGGRELKDYRRDGER